MAVLLAWSLIHFSSPLKSVTCYQTVFLIQSCTNTPSFFLPFTLFFLLNYFYQHFILHIVSCKFYERRDFVLLFGVSQDRSCLQMIVSPTARWEYRSPERYSPLRREQFTRLLQPNFIFKTLDSHGIADTVSQILIYWAQGVLCKRRDYVVSRNVCI